MRWDLVDSFEVLKKGVYSRAIKEFQGDEDFLAEHEPGCPRVPEPFFVEMIAQAGGVLFGLGNDFKKEVILAKIELARFEKTVAPPCRLTIEARIEEQREEGAWISGVVKQGDECVAKARILLVVMESLAGLPDKIVVFNDHFLSHYEIYKIAKQSEGIIV